MASSMNSDGHDYVDNLDSDWIIGADLYFPVEPISSTKDYRLSLTKSFSNCLIENNTFSEDLVNKEGGFNVVGLSGGPIPLNYKELSEILPISLTKLIKERPDIALPCLGFAIHKILCEISKKKCNGQTSSAEELFSTHDGNPHIRKVIPRLFTFDNVTPLRHLKANYIGKFVSVRGTVVRVSNIKPLAVEMTFRCGKCDQLVRCYFEDGKFRYPSRCGTLKCNSKTFIPQRSTAINVDWQKIRIQEQLDKKDPGRVPRTIECELTEDLVDSCVPGDIVTVCGIVKVAGSVIALDRGVHGDSNGMGNSSTSFNRIKEKTKSLLVIYIEANSIDNCKQVDNGKMDLMQFTARDMNCIAEICNEKNLFKLIVNSVCPAIYGHELVKGNEITEIFHSFRAIYRFSPLGARNWFILSVLTALFSIGLWTLLIPKLVLCWLYLEDVIDMWIVRIPCRTFNMPIRFVGIPMF